MFGGNLLANFGEGVAMILFGIGFANLLFQKNLIKKNMIIKPSRGKYKLKNNLFKLYLQNLGINQNTGLINY